MKKFDIIEGQNTMGARGKMAEILIRDDGSWTVVSAIDTSVFESLEWMIANDMKLARCSAEEAVLGLPTQWMGVEIRERR